MLKKIMGYIILILTTYLLVSITIIVISEHDSSIDVKFDSIAYKLKENMSTVANKVNLTKFMDQGKIISKEEAVDEVYRCLTNGERNLELTFKSEFLKEDEISEDVKDIVSLAIQKDDKKNSSDHDYLEHNFNYSFTGKYILSAATIHFEFDYLETKEETELVDSKIKEIFKELKIGQLDDDEKIKQIHDYIVNHTSYDLDYLKYTAYDALHNEKAVCQGYALLTYKMMLEAGIPCRIISGTADGESHAWNIVKLEDKWYNLDCTWDDPVTNTGENVLLYDYYLKNEADFSDHKRDKKYNTKKFNKKYPMAEKSIVIENEYD